MGLGGYLGAWQRYQVKTLLLTEQAPEPIGNLGDCFVMLYLASCSTFFVSLVESGIIKRRKI
jgi:hypothetical protein